MVGIVVRGLGAGEWGVYREVRLTALEDAPGAFGSDLERERGFSEQAWRERLARHGVIVAERGAVVCGVVGVKRVGERAAELVAMWVRPAERGRGVGDLLVRAAVARARRLGEVRLWVAEGNAHAERLYARHGFRRTGEVQPIRDGEPALEFAMVWEEA
jgi:GNAT superfamily N-acetyltransferase